MNEDLAKVKLPDIDLGSVHSKPYMTSRFGRTLERASYLDLSLVSISFVLLASGYFTFAPVGDGIARGVYPTSKFSDAIYFTLVTLTSLGYGDISPQGIGRIVACLTVLFGLAMVALIIGKAATERSQATILLLHTSDRERRLRGFAEQLESAREKLIEGTAKESPNDIGSATKDLKSVLESASNYIYFHAYQSKLGSFGNAPALFHLLNELTDTVGPVYGAMALSKLSSSQFERMTKILERIEMSFNFVCAMQEASESDWTSTLLIHLKLKDKAERSVSRGQTRVSRRLHQEIRIGREMLQSRITIDKLMCVLANCARGPMAVWPKSDHRRVAKEAGLSNKMTLRCIDELFSQGSLPK